MELVNLDDSEKNTIEMLAMFADMRLSQLILSKCNMQDLRTQNSLFRTVP